MLREAPHINHMFALSSWEIGVDQGAPKGAV
jgi:hypothetical protein